MSILKVCQVAVALIRSLVYAEYLPKRTHLTSMRVPLEVKTKQDAPQSSWEAREPDEVDVDQRVLLTQRNRFRSSTPGMKEAPSALDFVAYARVQL